MFYSIYGTSHFPTQKQAERYYRVYGFDAGDVQRKLDEGEIHLGAPPVLEGEELVLLDNQTRYGIQTRPRG
jgi:hypothetical protein